jgi:hypothetical protein
MTLLFVIINLLKYDCAMNRYTKWKLFFCFCKDNAEIVLKVDDMSFLLKNYKFKSKINRVCITL